MVHFVLRMIRSWFDFSLERGFEETSLPPAGERFPLPFTFKPHLSFRSACIAVSKALVNILCGTTLFAVCGTTAWLALEHIPNPALRVAALIPMVAVFLALLAFLLEGISSVFRAIFPWMVHKRESAAGS